MRKMRMAVVCEDCGFKNVLERPIIIPSKGHISLICHGCETPIGVIWEFALDGRDAPT